MRRLLPTMFLLLLLAPARTFAQSWTAPRTWTTGETVTATIMNTHVRDNLTVLRAGGIATASQAAGDVLCASSTTQIGRVAAVATGQVVISGGAATCPSYSATLPNAVQDNITRTGTLVSGATGAGFTLALATSTISGDLPDANLSANVPLLDAANTLTGGLQTVTRSTDGTALSVINTFATLTGEVLTTNTTRAASSAFTLMNLYANSVSQFSVSGAGAVQAAGTLAWGGGSAITSSNSVALLAGAAFTGDITVNDTATYSLKGTGANGIGIAATHASGDVRLYSRNGLALTLGASQAAAFTGPVTVTRSTDGTALSVINAFATLTGEVLTTNTTRAASSAFTLMNLSANSVSQFSVSGNGNVTAAGTVGWGGGSAITSSNSVALLAGAAFTGDITVNDTATYSLKGTGANGIGIAATHASGVLRFYSANTLRGTIEADGDFQWDGRVLSAAAQPGFLAYNSAQDNSVSADTAVDLDTEVYDTAGNFASDTFTAPITGKYLLCGAITLYNDNAGTVSRNIAKIVTSNRTYVLGGEAHNHPASEYWVVGGGCVVADMDASDTATLQFASTTTDNHVGGDATTLNTWFSGRLIP